MDEENNKQAPQEKPVPGDDSSVSLLRKQLYAKDESSEIKKRERELATPPQLGHKRFAKTKQPELVDVVAARSRKRRRYIQIGVTVIGFLLVGLAAAAATIWYRSSQQVTPDDAVITIDAPSDIVAGELVEYTVTYRNESRVRWDNVEFQLDMPGGFILRSATDGTQQVSKNQYALAVDSLQAGEEKTVSIGGQLLGEQDASLIMRAAIAFSPENFPSGRFDASQSHTVSVASVPVELSIDAPSQAADGERIVASIKVQNTGTEPLVGGRLQLEIPPGIQLATEDDEFSSSFSLISSSWELPTLQPLEEASRVAVWYLDGAARERRVVTAKTLVLNGEDEYLLRTAEQVMTISEAEVALSQTFNGESETLTVRAGEAVKSSLTYKNTGTSALQNIVITAQFEGSVLDPAKLKLSSGAYDPQNQTITWKAASVPELATLQPQQEGTIEYEFSLLPLEFLPLTEDAKNQNLIVTATIDSPDLPTTTGEGRRIITDRFILPVTTNAILEVDAFYDDGRLGIESTGPLPPEVGETTTYTLRFRLGSSLNDIGDVKMTAVLPETVTYTDTTYSTEGEIFFNDRTNEISWTLPFIEGLAGRAEPGPELHVQVSITPGENLRGDEVQLLQSANMLATDLFSDEAVATEVVERDLPNTEDAAEDQGKVE